ncbi:MAG: cytochrome c4 [Gammaproteobacteria bacterium]|jgi:cytochrome c553|nr:cytochrome c4 [Gammaproteobacteria bacterium]MCP4881479.1 cytochrome c4 [Gammaproteobacteria bacterium]MDP6165230.1 c-type cytochrome [Gammaproteobacteria bacterium]
MKKIVACILMTFGWMSLAHAAGDATAGQGKIALCAGCHGADGNSMVASFPKLAGQGERYLVKQMNDIRSGARVIPEMTAMLDNMSEQDIADIAAYFAGQTSTVGAAKAELVVAGEMMYLAGNAAKSIPACAACHSPTGAGNAQAGFPSLGGQHAAYTSKQLKNFRTEMRTNDDAKIMRQVAALMSDKEIEAVASYIQGLSN